MPSYLNEEGYHEKPGVWKRGEPLEYYNPLNKFTLLDTLIAKGQWRDVIELCIELVDKSKDLNVHGWQALGVGTNQVVRAPQDVQDAVQILNEHVSRRQKNDQKKRKK